jgi:hypothetical protein
MSDQKYPAPQWQQVEPYQSVDAIRRPNVVRGTQSVEKVPKLPFQYYLDPSGNLVRLAVASTRNFKGATEAGGDPMRTVKFNQGHAVREGFMPWEYVDAKSQIPGDVGMRSREEWEKFREEELQRRRAAHNEKTSRHNNQWENSEEKKAGAFVDALSKMVDKKIGDEGNPFRRKGKPE